MDKSPGTLLRFWGVFQFTQVQPLPSPHKQCCTPVSRIFFSEFRLCIGWGGSGGRENCEKISKKKCTVWRGNREMTEKYEYCSTVPRTFVQDCSFSLRLFVYVFLLLNIFYPSCSSRVSLLINGFFCRSWIFCAQCVQLKAVFQRQIDDWGFIDNFLYDMIQLQLQYLIPGWAYIHKRKLSWEQRTVILCFPFIL